MGTLSYISARMSKESVVGKYDYFQPGSLNQWTQTLTLNADGTGSYWEKIETKQDTVTREGAGSWRIEESEKGPEMYLEMKTLKKVTKSKMMQLVPGLGDSVKEDNNVIIGVLVDKLPNAPPAASKQTNKWRL